MQRGERESEHERGGNEDRHTKIAAKHTHTHMPVFRRNIKQKPKQATPSDRLDE